MVLPIALQLEQEADSLQRIQGLCNAHRISPTDSLFRTLLAHSPNSEEVCVMFSRSQDRLFWEEPEGRRLSQRLCEELHISPEVCSLLVTSATSERHWEIVDHFRKKQDLFSLLSARYVVQLHRFVLIRLTNMSSSFIFQCDFPD